MSFDPWLRKLSPRLCVRCDYPLHAQATPAVCPECGWHELPDVITLRGWNQSIPRLTHWVDWIVPVSCGLGLWLIGVLMFFADSVASIWVFGSLGLVAALWRWARRMWWHWWNRAGEPPLRCILSSGGFVLGIGNNFGPLRLWQGNWMATVSWPSWRGRCWLTIKPKMGFITVSKVEPVLRMDLDANAEQIAALQEQIQQWLAGAGVGHAFEIVPMATAVKENEE